MYDSFIGMEERIQCRAQETESIDKTFESAMMIQIKMVGIKMSISDMGEGDLDNNSSTQ